MTTRNKNGQKTDILTAYNVEIYNPDQYGGQWGFYSEHETKSEAIKDGETLNRKFRIKKGKILELNAMIIKNVSEDLLNKQFESIISIDQSKLTGEQSEALQGIINMLIHADFT